LLGAEGALLAAGFGDVGSALAIHGPEVTAVEVALLAGATYCILHALGILLALEARPWRPGLYLFPGCVVDARRPVLKVWPMAQAEALERVTGPSPGIALRMQDGSRVVVPAPNLEVAERAEAALQPLRRELARALESGDAHVLAELDPLHELAMSSPIGPTGKMRPNVPLWTRFDWLIAAAVGALLGGALATTRNTLSDDAMFRRVAAAGTIEAYRAYLARGAAHVPDVRDVLLPRAELREAQAVGTVEAIETFAREHPGTRIGAEIELALRRASLAALEAAKAQGTVSALDAFARNSAGHGVDAEIARARHAMFGQTLAAWRSRAHPDLATSTFAERLFGWVERNGKPCEVRFREKPSSTLDDADKAVSRSGNFPGPDALPSRYLTPEALQPREQRVADALVTAFGGAFPPDVLTLRAGPPLEAEGASVFDTPTLVIEFSPEWSHANTASVKPRTVFATLNFTFDVTFTLPDGPPPWKLLVKAWRGAESWKVKSEGLGREEFEQKVYDAMIDGAFDQLEKKLVDAWL
jgi:hypothetical protein